jgi:phosphoglucomutase
MAMGWEGDGQWGVDGDMQETMGRRGSSKSNSDSDGDSDKTTTPTTTTTTMTSNRSTTTAASSSTTRTPQPQQYTTALESSPASGVADRVYPQP